MVPMSDSNIDSIQPSKQSAPSKLAGKITLGKGKAATTVLHIYKLGSTYEILTPAGLFVAGPFFFLSAARSVAATVSTRLDKLDRDLQDYCEFWTSGYSVQATTKKAPSWDEWLNSPDYERIQADRANRMLPAQQAAEYYQELSDSDCSVGYVCVPDGGIEGGRLVEFGQSFPSPRSAVAGADGE